MEVTRLDLQEAAHWVRRSVSDRDALARAAREQGASAQWIATSLGVSRQRVYQIINEGRTEES